MPHKNSDKEPANQRVVQSVIERYEEQQNTLGTKEQNQSCYESMTELSPRTMRALLGELTQDVVGQDAIELGRITFEAKKKMAVDDNPFLQPLGINMITTGFKGGLPKFKLVVHNGEEDSEPHPSVFERLKGKEVKRDEEILCARCSREVNENVEKKKHGDIIIVLVWFQTSSLFEDETYHFMEDLISRGNSDQCTMVERSDHNLVNQMYGRHSNIV
ncbi:putative retroelement [Abeliophyllum distichum]|uniref:Retroelement n=1 Tax=Abeliophyllum distichum TaxID=126358 RepID=A0ABD1UIP0_9LAMI